MHLEKLLLHCLISITTVVHKHTILQIAEDASGQWLRYSFYGQRHSSFAVHQDAADEHISSYYLDTKMKDSNDLEDLYEEVAIFSVQEVTRLMILPLPLLQHVHVLGPLALF